MTMASTSASKIQSAWHVILINVRGKKYRNIVSTFLCVHDCCVAVVVAVVAVIVVGGGLLLLLFFVVVVGLGGGGGGSN